MAKLATQNIVIQISKAVADNDNDHIDVIDKESLAQLEEAVVAMAGDGVVVELGSD